MPRKKTEEVVNYTPLILSNETVRSDNDSLLGQINMVMDHMGNMLSKALDASDADPNMAYELGRIDGAIKLLSMLIDRL